MAEDQSNDYEVVPTKEKGQFHFPVWFSPAQVPFSSRKVASSSVAGCKCDATFFRCDDQGEIRLTLTVRHGANPRIQGIKVIPNMVLLDKTGSPTSIGTVTTMCFSKNAVTYNQLRLRAVSEDVKANCVVDDVFEVMCSLEVTMHGRVTMDRTRALSFDVDGRASVHNASCLLPNRLYGSMAESKMASITIQEMGASAFRSMLHYMYHGSLPNASKTDISSTMTEYQCLLVAADRYGLESLKKICEDKLCGNGITVDNVVSMLELADGHVCPRLKDRCLDFLSDGENFKMVATTDRYFHLMQTVPSLLIEVRNRFKMTHEKTTITEPGA